MKQFSEIIRIQIGNTGVKQDWGAGAGRSRSEPGVFGSLEPEPLEKPGAGAAKN